MRCALLAGRGFEILQELSKCDTETRNEQMFLAKMLPIDLPDAGLPQTFNLQNTQCLPSATKQSAIKGGLPA